MTAKAAVKERPILFSGPMVRAILDGLKTQTRRVMKPQPATDDFADYRTDLGYPASEGKLWAGFWGCPKTKQVSLESDGKMGSPLYYRCPYGTLGEELWVREAVKVRAVGPEKGQFDIIYKADDFQYGIEIREFKRVEGYRPLSFTRWTPSLFMPRWACRLILQVRSVRVQRLRDITEFDAKFEGVELGECDHPDCSPGSCASSRYRPAFAQLWDKLNAKRGYGWETNPWVWAVEFEKIYR